MPRPRARRRGDSAQGAAAASRSPSARLSSFLLRKKGRERETRNSPLFFERLVSRRSSYSSRACDRGHALMIFENRRVILSQGAYLRNTSARSLVRSVSLSLSLSLSLFLDAAVRLRHGHTPLARVSFPARLRDRVFFELGRREGAFFAGALVVFQLPEIQAPSAPDRESDAQRRLRALGRQARRAPTAHTKRRRGREPSRARL